MNILTYDEITILTVPTISAAWTKILIVTAIAIPIVFVSMWVILFPWFFHVEPPVIEPIDDKTVQLGQPLIFIVEASDPEGDVLFFSLVSPDDGGATINQYNGLFTWTPDEVGPVDFTVLVTEQSTLLQLSDDATFRVTVTPRPPTGVGGGAVGIPDSDDEEDSDDQVDDEIPVPDNFTVNAQIDSSGTLTVEILPIGGIVIHENNVLSYELSSDNKFIVVKYQPFSSDSRISVFELPDGNRVITDTGVSSTEFSPAVNAITYKHHTLQNNRHNLVQVFRLPSGNLVAGDEYVYSAPYTPSGHYVIFKYSQAQGVPDHLFEVYRISSGAQIIGETDMYQVTTCHVDDSIIFRYQPYSSDSKASVFRLPNGEPAFITKINVNSVSYSADCRTVTFNYYSGSPESFSVP